MSASLGQLNTRDEDTKNLDANYLALLHEFKKLIAHEGYEITIAAANQPLYFASLPKELQRQVLENFGRYVDVCKAVLQDGKKISDDRHFLWRMIQKLGLHPSSDLFNTIEPNDFIEIYNLDFIQIFRNLKFFKVCSYTLDEILSRPWWELFKREQAITDKIIADASSVFNGSHAGIKFYTVGVHTVDEIYSPKLNRSVLENRFFAPLYDDKGKVTAGVNVIRGISCRSMLKSQKTEETKERIRIIETDMSLE